jgi:regulator of sigma E protease
MQTFFGSVWWLIVSLGILVTFHEFGHFWVARRCGIRVLRFSVGFGTPLWRRMGRDGTEYQIAAIPLGGYVKMLDEREQDVAPEDRPFAFNNKPVWQRIAVVAAGPGFNLILCLALLWLMYLIGKPDYLPLVGRAEAIAASAGVAKGDRLLAIDGEPTPTWTDVTMRLAEAALEGAPVTLRVQRASGQEQQLTLALDQLSADQRQAQPLQAIGLTPLHALLPAVVGEVQAGSGAEGVLKAGDRIERIGVRAIDGWDQVSEAVQAQASADAPLLLQVRRDGGLLDLSVRPRLDSSGETPRWMLGIGPARAQAHYDTLQRYGVVAAAEASARETWMLARNTLSMLGKMVAGKASLQNLSGPLTIAKVANASAQLGLAWFLYFLALMSLSLCIINLLPIPILDGGHLLYYLIESIKGSPVSERAMIAGQYVGLTLLVGLMGLALYNDVLFHLR